MRQGFIAAVLGVPPEEIIRTELLPTYLWKKRKKEKQGILDVRVLINGMDEMDVEIQVEAFREWPERSVLTGQDVHREPAGGRRLRKTAQVYSRGDPGFCPVSGR